MSIKLIVNVDNVNDLRSTAAYGTGALLRLERSSLPDSGFAETATTPLVDDQTQYEFWDSTGTSSHYYRSRVSNGAATSYSDYSNVFRGTDRQAYATLDSLLETMDLPDESRYNVLSDMLVRASDHIDRNFGRRFYRDPGVSGDGTWTFNVRYPGARRLSEAIGPIDIVSVTSLGIAASTGESFDTVTEGATGFYLSEGLLPGDPPYTDLLLSDIGSSYLTFPTGYGVVQLVGVRGFPSVPPMVEQACIDLAREWYRQGPLGGGPVGITATGIPVFGPGTPTSYQQAWADYRMQRFTYVG